MMDVIASEWQKLRSLRSNGYLLAASVLAVLACAGMAYLTGRGFDGQTFEERVAFPSNGAGLGTGLPVAFFVFSALGALTITSEYATGMIRTSLAVVPRRQVFLFAKVPGLAAVTLIAGQVLAFVMHLAAQAVLGDRAGQLLTDGGTLGTSLSEPGVLVTVVVAGLSMAAAALVGLGVGAAIRSTPGSLVALVMIFLVIPVIAQALPSPLRSEVGSYMMENLPAQVAGVSGLLPPGAALALLVGYVAAALTAGATVTALRRGRIKVLAVGAAATLLAGLMAVPAAGDSATSTLVWGRCTGKDAPEIMRCTTIEVPLDWKKPAGRKITLPLALLPATGVQRRIGTVFSVPGGPGASGIDDLNMFHGKFAKLRDRFDVISFAPRNTVKPGFGPLSYECLSNGPLITLPDDRAEYAALGRTNRERAQQCRSADPEFFDHMDSASSARDIEAVRTALGERQLSFLANSYGGHPAVSYARLFPSRIRAMVMDGTTNHIGSIADEETNAYADNEKQLERFAAWCRSSTACALHGQDVVAVWRRLVTAADMNPVPAMTDPTGAAYSGFDFKVASAPSFTSPGPEPAVPRWVELADAIKRAAVGDASGFADYVRRATGNPEVPSLIGGNMTECLDGRAYKGYAEYMKLRQESEKLSPNFAGHRAWWPLGCVGWPVPVSNPRGPLSARGLVPFLGVGTWTDHDNVASIIHHVPGSSSVKYEGHGHMMYTYGNTGCVTAHVNRYFISLRLPPQGTTCQATG
ncbi:hypothetical protein DMB42_02300 [Nonomuraea sp. WAC 01424]|uniref:alpha/beta fold hydrolase n=1 Tax=Nonomuraea sp. WAC 01424 TaxID=2203200 RepID=UPI000F799F59|nr:alpha/beta fold hydrolase [Nonomuraea sp. WAC 01424]RSN15658.1 hypothetical protein DMB42_02300 [Nonomuraea sp. WAC 01424]